MELERDNKGYVKALIFKSEMILYSADLSDSKPTAVAMMYVRTVRLMLLKEFGCSFIRLGIRTGSNSVRFEFGSIRIARLLCRQRFTRLLFKTR